MIFMLTEPFPSKIYLHSVRTIAPVGGTRLLDVRHGPKGTAVVRRFVGLRPDGEVVKRTLDGVGEC